MSTSKKIVAAAKKTTTTKTTAAKTTAAVEFKGATLKMYTLLKQKSLTHAAVMAFKKANDLRSAYQILFRLRRIGLRTKQFTIVATGDVKANRSYKLVKGVVKGTPANWVKAMPTRTAKSTKKATAKKTTAAKSPAKKSPAKKTVAKKVVKATPKSKQTVLVGADDDAAVSE